MRWRRQAQIAASINPNTWPGRLTIGRERASALRHNPRLNRKATRRANRFLITQSDCLKRGAVGDPKLRFNQINASDLLRHGVLNLDSRIAFDKVIQIRFGNYQELNRAGILVAGGARQLQSVGQNSLAQGLT